MSAQISDVPTVASLDDLVAQAGRMDFDLFAPPGGRDDDAKKRAETSEYQRVAQLAAALWTTEPFRDIVAQLCAGTLHRVTFVSPLQLGPELGYAYGVFREGQNAVVFGLLKMIADGQKLTVKDRGP